MFVVVLGSLVWRLGEAPLSGTEPHRAIPAHQMLQSGDWLMPRLWGEPYLAKPPLQYWVLAIAEGIAGTANEWVWRLPSAISSALLAALLCVTAGRWFGRSAGWISGLSYLGLLALWSQSRKVDIDALHTLAAVSAVICLIELNCRTSRFPLRWTLAAGLAFGAALLLKGPAGLPIIIGAVLGPPLLGRDWSALRRGHIWVALLIGALMFAGWMFAVYLTLHGGSVAGGWTGLSQVGRTLSNLDPIHLLKALLLPLILVGYAMPLAAAAPLAMHPAIANSLDLEARRTVRGLVATLLVALGVGVLARTINPRYMYILFPLLCPLAGAIGAVWKTGTADEPVRRLVRQLLAVFAIVLVGVHLGMIAVIWVRSDAPFVWSIVLAGLTVVVCAWTIRKWAVRQDVAGAWGVLSLLMLLSFPFPAYTFQQRTARSSALGGLKLRELIGNDTKVTSGVWVLNAPELFYYAKVDVDFRPNRLTVSTVFDDDTWVVFHELEWNVRSAKERAAFDHVTVLPTRSRNAIAAHYHAEKAKVAGRSP